MLVACLSHLNPLKKYNFANTHKLNCVQSCIGYVRSLLCNNVFKLFGNDLSIVASAKRCDGDWRVWVRSLCTSRQRNAARRRETAELEPTENIGRGAGERQRRRAA